MNIAVDLQPLATVSCNRGMGRYTSDLLDKLFELDSENNYYLFNMYGECEYDHKVLPPNVHYEKLYMGEKNFLLLNIKENGSFGVRYESIINGIFQTFIKKNKIDMFFITSVFDAIMAYKKEWFYGTKLAVIAYDLIPLIFKELYLEDYFMRERYLQNLDCLKNADIFLAISESVKSDLIEYLKIAPEKITTIYAGVSKGFKQKLYSDQEKKKALKRYRINSKFMIFPSGQDFRKNNENTILGYSKMPRALINKYQLVITGNATEEYINEMHSLSAKCNVDGRVVITGHIPYDDLLLLYNVAELVVFPSKYEGFGLPVLEAFACGKNVVTSNNSSLGEVAADAAVLVDPFETDDIARGFESALAKTDFSLFKDEIQKKLAFYTWENSAKKTLDSFLLQGSTVEKKELTYVLRKKLAFFAPLNPIRSGISDYCEDLVDELCEYFDIDIFIDDGYKAEKQFNANVNVYNHSMFENRVFGYDYVIYQLGNSTYHIYMHPYLKKYPGVIVLHDLNMHNLFYWVYAKQEKWEKYREYLSYEINKNDFDMLVDTINNDEDKAKSLVSNIVVNRFAADNAKKIIVHSDYAREKLLEKNIGYQIQKIFHYAKSEINKDSLVLRAKYNIPENEIVIASFGHADWPKRILSCIKALESIFKAYDNVRYYIVGEVHIPEIMDYIQKKQLEKNVVVTGFIEDIDKFKDYIQMSDICLNLRYPHNGETSGSLMRILAMGKTVVVTDVGTFSEIPDDCCVKVGYDEDTEVKEIEQAVTRLIDDREYAERLGKNARKFAEENLSIKKIAREYYEFITDETPSYISEDDIDRIHCDLKNFCSDDFEDECRKLAKTLAYLIDPDQKGDGQAKS